MRVTAEEVWKKMAAPLPGAGAFPPRPKVAPPTGVEPRVAPPSASAPPNAASPEEDFVPEEGAPQQNGETPSIQGIVKTLDQYFTDDKIQSISSNMLTLMKVVPPESGEKLSKVFTKLMEAMMSMKANIAALQVMAMPAQQQTEMMQKNLQQLTQAAPTVDQGIKSGPITAFLISFGLSMLGYAL